MPAPQCSPVRRSLWLLGLTMGLGSCAHAPRQEAPPQLPASVPRTWESPPLRANLAALGVTSLDVAAPLNSTEALAAALAFSPELELQRAQLALARADVMKAKQRPNPVLSLSPEHVLGAVEGGLSPWVVALSLVWPVRTAGKRELEIEQALATSDAALLDGAGAVWALRTTVRDATCALQIANARQSLAREEADLRADLAQRLGKQADAGVVSSYDAMRAQLERDQALQRLRQSESALSTARHDLADATGLPAAEIARRPAVTDCLPATAREPEALADLETRAIASRLDLRARLAEYRAVDAAWRTEVKRRIPDLNLGPGYTYDHGERRITFTLSAELPLFNHNDAAIARAAADRDRAIAEVDRLQWTVRSGVERAVDQLALGRQQLADSLRVAQEAQDLLTRDRQRQESGEIDQPTVIASQLISLSARIDALDATRALLDAVSALESAVQSPLMPPFFDAEAATRQVSPAAPEESAR
ncbi:MAG TPA: TolC family protein [Steroidobacteraceae bacterium]|nr:TolC family protein [Steroidobacteraceae bacterium]